MKKQYVIIGASAAGIAALTTLKRLDPEADVLVISRDGAAPYNTCLLGSFISGSKELDDLMLLSESQLQELRGCLLFNTEVISINRAEKNISAYNKKSNTFEIIDYDKLLLATGSEPAQIITEDEQQAGFFSFHTLSDIISITNYLDSNSVEHAVVVGGGINGIECADALAKKGISVTIIERSAQLLPHLLNAQANLWLERYLADKNVMIYTQASIESYIVANDTKEMILTNGNTIKAHMVIYATGSRPALDLARRAGLDIADALITDQYLTTSDNTIWAAGDCALVTCMHTCQLTRSITWHDAIAQGVVAAYNMAGIVRAYKGLLLNIHSSFFCINMVYNGFKTQKGYTNFLRVTSDSCIVYNLDQNNILQNFIIMGTNALQQREHWLKLLVSKQKITQDIQLYSKKVLITS